MLQKKREALKWAGEWTPGVEVCGSVKVMRGTLGALEASVMPEVLQFTQCFYVINWTPLAFQANLW